jgi:hypothetical protein
VATKAGGCDAACKEIGDLEEAQGECINGWFGLIFIVIDDCGDLAA